MSEVYWITGTQGWDSSQPVNTWLKQVGLNPAWMDETFRFIKAGEGNRNQVHTENGAFTVDSTAAHRLFQLILSDLLTGWNNLVLLIEQHGISLSLAALATPRAVGRFNLRPAARMQVLRGLRLSQSPIEHTAIILENIVRMELTPESIVCLAAPGLDGDNLKSAFPNSQPVDLSAGDGLIETFLALLNPLHRQPGKASIFIDRKAPLATLMEVL